MPFFPFCHFVKFFPLPKVSSSDLVIFLNTHKCLRKGKMFKNVHFITAVCSTNIESPRVCVILCSYLYQADIFKWRMKYATNLKETQTNKKRKEGNSCTLSWPFPFQTSDSCLSVSVMLSANDSETAWSSLRLFDCACITYNFYY